MALKAPFGWVGGKHYVARQIIPFIPPHHLYVEVFGGGLSLFYQKEMSKCEIVNDINDELINLHLCIKNKPETLTLYLENMVKSKTLFEAIKDKKIQPKNDIEQAAFTFYIINNSFGSNQRSFHHFFHKSHPERNHLLRNHIKDFKKYSKRMKYVVLENRSFERLIPSVDSSGTFFYCDPPYVGTENYYKNCSFGEKEHKKLREVLGKIQGKFILSYNDNDFIRELYKDFFIKNISVQYCMNNARRYLKAARELLIANFDMDKVAWEKSKPRAVAVSKGLFEDLE